MDLVITPVCRRRRPLLYTYRSIRPMWLRMRVNDGYKYKYPVWKMRFPERRLKSLLFRTGKAERWCTTALQEAGKTKTGTFIYCHIITHHSRLRYFSPQQWSVLNEPNGPYSFALSSLVNRTPAAGRRFSFSGNKFSLQYAAEHPRCNTATIIAAIATTGNNDDDIFSTNGV